MVRAGKEGLQGGGHGGLPIILAEYALYANAPHLRQITGYGRRYVINV
jgi:hypothetical protein